MLTRPPSRILRQGWRIIAAHAHRYGRRLGAISGLILIIAGAGGCATVAPDKNFSDVQAIALQRLQADIQWHEQAGEPAQQEIRALLEDGELTVRKATQIALVNNPEIQAFYEEIGIAEAEFVAAGLLPNPVLSATVRFPDRSPLGTNVEFDIIGNLLNLLMRSARMHVSALAADESVLRVSSRVLEFAAEVEQAFLRLQGALNKYTLLQQMAEAARATSALADHMHQAGNLDALTRALDQALAEQAQVDLLRAELNVAQRQSKLRQMMGLTDDGKALPVVGELPAVPSAAPVFAELRWSPLEHRLDLAVAKQVLERLSATYGMKLDWSWLSLLEAGVSGARDPDRQFVVGPSLNIALPLFDRGQADLARTAAELRRQQQQVAALALEILTEVGTARARVEKQHAIALRYRDTLVPLHRRIAELSEKRYEYMLAGAFDLLAARKERLRVSSEYVDAVTEYWIAEAELRRALGGGYAGQTDETSDAGQSE